MKTSLAVVFLSLVSISALADSYPVFQCKMLKDNQNGKVHGSESFKILTLAADVYILQTSRNGSANVSPASPQTDGTYSFECLKLLPTTINGQVTSFKIETVCEDFSSSAECNKLPLF